MARAQINIDRSSTDVFEAISDPSSYERWLVGCKAIRSIDREWPLPESRFRHAVGFGPVTVKDSTKLLEIEPGRRLVLEARARPAGIARVEFRVTESPTGAEVTLLETSTGGFARRVWQPLVEIAVRLRNEWSLRRLKAFLEPA